MAKITHVTIKTKWVLVNKSHWWGKSNFLTTFNAPPHVISLISALCPKTLCALSQFLFQYFSCIKAPAWFTAFKEKRKKQKSPKKPTQNQNYFNCAWRKIPNFSHNVWRQQCWERWLGKIYVMKCGWTVMLITGNFWTWSCLQFSVRCNFFFSFFSVVLTFHNSTFLWTLLCCKLVYE